MSNNTNTTSLKDVLDRCSGHTVNLKKQVAEASGMSLAHINLLYSQENMDGVKLAKAVRIFLWANENLVAGAEPFTLENVLTSKTVLA